jgi:hypothetical protein
MTNTVTHWFFAKQGGTASILSPLIFSGAIFVFSEVFYVQQLQG